MGRVKLNVSLNNHRFVESDHFLLKTHVFPSNGQCYAYHSDRNQNKNHLLNQYILKCTDWNSHIMDNQQLKYNALYSNVAISSEFVSSEQLLMNLGGSGDVIITALIQDAANTISCYDVVVPLPAMNSTNIDVVTGDIENMIDSNNTQKNK